MDFIYWYLMSYSRGLYSDQEPSGDHFQEDWDVLQKKYKEEMEKNLLDPEEKSIELTPLDVHIIENALNLYINQMNLYEMMFYDGFYGLCNFIDKKEAENILEKIQKEQEKNKLK